MSWQLGHRGQAMYTLLDFSARTLGTFVSLHHHIHDASEANPISYRVGITNSNLKWKSSLEAEHLPLLELYLHSQYYIFLVWYMWGKSTVHQDFGTSSGLNIYDYGAYIFLNEEGQCEHIIWCCLLSNFFL